MRSTLSPLAACLAMLSTVALAQPVFINEIHYDNAGNDRDEAIEIAGPAGTDLSGWRVVLYNGADGLPGASFPLAGSLPDQRQGFGLMLVILGGNMLQNGAPDGIALIDADDNVVQFLSYEGRFRAEGGPAAGMMADAIPVREDSRTPPGQSLQLSGTGSHYGDFQWMPPGAETYGLPSHGQRFGAGAAPPVAACPEAPEEAPLVTPMAVQGQGFSSPLRGHRVSVEGTVSAAFPGADGLGGFFIQDPVGDADPATSDGLFIAAGDAAPTVGERVQVVGTVVEHFGQTQLGEVSDVQLCGPGEAVTATALSLPAPAGLEHLEGMLVNLPDTLSISDVHDLGRFGELLLAAGGRLMIPSNQVDPDAVNDLARDNLQRRILLDDGSNRRNVVPPYQLADGRPPRVGDSVGGLSGVLGYAFGDYRIQPLAAPVFTPANSRPLEPPAVGGRLRVASFNVLNYFISLGQRGADTPEELQRQADKLVAALAALDAHIVALVEVENTRPLADTALADLLVRLNAALGEDFYTMVPAPAWTGEDAIRTALIYRPDRVTPVGAARSSDPARDPAYRVLKRPAMAQIFEADGERFTVVVNHFKSKGGCLDDAADPDADHGQGCWNALRSQQARALLDFAEELTTLADDPDVLVLGDLNAYGREDPIDILRAGGLIDQLAVRLDPMARYTYVYDGASGYLDHVLTSASLNPRVGGLTVWHINADETPVLDYRADNPAGLYRSDPFRSSDHDPVLIGLFPVAPVPEPQEDGQIADYYAPVVDLSGPALRAGLHALIRDHQQLAYGAAWRVLAESDAEPDTPDTVRLVYALRAQPVDFSARGNNDPDAWNREHVWPRSRGLGSTGRRGPATDIHNLKPADASINSARGNLDFDGDGLPHEECSACLRDDDSWSPPVGQRGDIARIAFYPVARKAPSFRSGMDSATALAAQCRQRRLLLDSDNVR